MVPEALRSLWLLMVHGWFLLHLLCLLQFLGVEAIHELTTGVSRMFLSKQETTWIFCLKLQGASCRSRGLAWVWKGLEVELGKIWQTQMKEAISNIHSEFLHLTKSYIIVVEMIQNCTNQLDLPGFYSTLCPPFLRKPRGSNGSQHGTSVDPKDGFWPLKTWGPRAIVKKRGLKGGKAAIYAMKMPTKTIHPTTEGL